MKNILSGRPMVMVAGAVLVGLVLVLAVSCGDDKGVQPTPPGEYAVYFMENYYETGNWFFRYVPATNEIDSTFLNYGYGYVVSADGEKMYIRDRDDGDTDILKLPTFEKIGELPYPTVLAVSPDNRLLAVYDTALHVLKTSDYTSVYDTVFDTVSMGSALFSANSERLYGQLTSGPGALKYLLSIDIRSGTVREYQPPFDAGITDVAVSPDETQLYFYLRIYSFDFLFVVYDVTTDSVVFSNYITPGSGELTTTPGGQFVLYTNPGNLSSMPGDQYISVYDVSQNQMTDPISSVGLMKEPYENGMEPWRLYVTPDGKWLVTLPYLSYPGVMTADMSKQEMAHYLILTQTWNDGLDGPKQP